MKKTSRQNKSTEQRETRLAKLREYITSQIQLKRQQSKGKLDLQK